MRRYKIWKRIELSRKEQTRKNEKNDDAHKKLRVFNLVIEQLVIALDKQSVKKVA